jgi:short-subunit dehydrogenase
LQLSGCVGSGAVELEGKRILLSGATGGLGRAIAAELAGEGARLVLSSRKREQLDELARELPGGVDRHKVLVADLADEGSAEKLVRAAQGSGALDGLVANAALPASGAIDRFSYEELARALRVNLEAPIRMTRELMPALVERGAGQLVYISSLQGRVATTGSALYSATKFGLRGFAFGLREDLFKSGVGVSIVSPGFVREAGLFADSGVKRAPGGVGSTTPRKVGKAVARAMKRNRSEIVVAPFRQRRLATFAGRHPEFAGRITRSTGLAAKAAEEISAGQADKR